jgi:hypothetical protein
MGTWGLDELWINDANDLVPVSMMPLQGGSPEDNGAGYRYVCEQFIAGLSDGAAASGSASSPFFTVSTVPFDPVWIATNQVNVPSRVWAWMPEVFDGLYMCLYGQADGVGNTNMTQVRDLYLTQMFNSLWIYNGHCVDNALGVLTYSAVNYQAFFNTDSFRTAFGLVCMASGPLMLISYPPLTDGENATAKNWEAINIDQDPLRAPACLVSSNYSSLSLVCSKPLFNGDVAVGLLNLGDVNTNTISVSFTNIPLCDNVMTVYDVYGKALLGNYTNSLSSAVNPKGLNLYRLSKPRVVGYTGTVVSGTVLQTYANGVLISAADTNEYLVNLSYQWVADDLASTNNHPVNAWTDRIQGLVLTNGAASTTTWPKVQNDTNGHVAIAFGDVSNGVTLLTNAAPQIVNPYTVVMALKFGALPGGYYYTMIKSYGSPFDYFSTGSSGTLQINGGLYLTDSVTPSWLVNWGTVAYIMGTSGGIWTNGVPAVTGSSGAHNLNGITIGADSNSGPWVYNNLYGRIAEIRIYSGALTATQIGVIRNHFKAVYGTL